MKLGNSAETETEAQPKIKPAMTGRTMIVVLLLGVLAGVALVHAVNLHSIHLGRSTGPGEPTGPKPQPLPDPSSGATFNQAANANADGASPCRGAKVVKVVPLQHASTSTSQPDNAWVAYCSDGTTVPFWTPQSVLTLR